MHMGIMLLQFVKSKGGIVGISLNEDAWERETSQKRAAITTMVN